MRWSEVDSMQLIISETRARGENDALEQESFRVRVTEQFQVIASQHRRIGGIGTEQLLDVVELLLLVGCQGSIAYLLDQLNSSFALVQKR